MTGLPLDDEIKLITCWKKLILIFKFYIEINNKKYIIDYKIILEKIDDKNIISKETIKYSIYMENSWKKWNY